MDIKSTLKKSGVSVIEFSSLCGVSRMTVYNWVKGDAIDPLRMTKVQKLCDALDAATLAGDFPLGTLTTRVKSDKQVRMALIKKHVISHLGKLAQAS